MTSINVKKLKTIITNEDWDEFLENIKPKNFIKQESKEQPDTSILVQICLVLITETTPDMIKILCLKCLMNSCVLNLKYKQHKAINIESDKYSKNLYDELDKSNLCQYKECDYPHHSHFPYDGIIEWTVNYIRTHDKSTDCLSDSELNLFRLSIQFLCNLFTCACADATSVDNVVKYLSCDNLKQALLTTMHSDHKLLANVACTFVQNALTRLPNDYFTKNDERNLWCQLLKPVNRGFGSAHDALLYLLHQSNDFEEIYNSMAINEKLDLLEIIYDELDESWQSDFDLVLTDDKIEFLALTFCKKSDLILKTVDTYVDSIDPKEVILLLNILGLLTTKCKISKNSKSLLINCKYLLMSLHMLGKESDNYFTPITNLGKVLSSAQRGTINKNSATNDTEASNEATIDKCEPQDHPAFGFKAGLIRIIANMVYKNKMCQDLFREIDGIPLLLDCCNIDARNPLIMQWTILALKNLCEGNPENQEIISNCKKEGVPNNSVLQEMGLTLHEDADGKSIRIAPLRRD